jgi:hypothetical protein
MRFPRHRFSAHRQLSRAELKTIRSGHSNSMKPKPELEYIKLSELVIDLSHSGRSEKEIKDNAKTLAPIMAAFGGWDAMQPGQYFVNDDGKKHLLAGFTRHAAALINGETHGYFFRNDADETTRRFLFITTNEGRGVSRFQQGLKFAEAERGVVADDFKGTIADPKKASDWKVKPMDREEIAKLIGKSEEHIRQCIIVSESAPEIRELLETEQVSFKSVLDADAWSKGDKAKQLQILRRALKEANGERVTGTHMRLIKPLFVKERAVPSTIIKNTPTSDSQEQDGKEPDEKPGTETGENDGGSTEPAELNLGSTRAPKPATKAQAKTVRETAIAVIAKWDEDIGHNSLGDEDLSGMVEALGEAGLLVSIATPAPF